MGVCRETQSLLFWPNYGKYPLLTYVKRLYRLCTKPWYSFPVIMSDTINDLKKLTKNLCSTR